MTWGHNCESLLLSSCHSSQSLYRAGAREPPPPDLHCASPADYLCLDKAGKAHRLVLQMKLLIQTCMSTLIIGVDCAH